VDHGAGHVAHRHSDLHPAGLRRAWHVHGRNRHAFVDASGCLPGSDGAERGRAGFGGRQRLRDERPDVCDLVRYPCGQDG